MFFDTKSPLKSKTVWGAIIAVAPPVLGVFGVSPADAMETTEHVNAIISGVGGLVAIYGRFKATTKLGK